MNTQTLKELKRTPNPASAISNQSAVVALISAGAVIILLILLHFLKDDVNPNWQPISEYALGKYGWIVTLAFLSLSVACFALFWTLRSQTKTIIGKIGFGLLLVASLGCLLAAIFTTDPATTDQDSLSLNGQLHGTGASLAGLIPFALLFITLALIRNANWKNNKAQLWTATALVWLGEIVFVIAMIVYLPNNDGKLGPDTPIGWYNRLMILTYALGILWFGLMAANVKRKG